MAEETDGTAPVSVNECERKHGSTWRLLMFVGIVAVVFVAAASWSVSVGYTAIEASNKANERTWEVHNDLRTHAKVQNGEYENIENRLKQISDRQAENRTEVKVELERQRTMIEDLLIRDIHE